MLNFQKTLLFNMKNTIALALALFVVFISGCGNKDEEARREGFESYEQKRALTSAGFTSLEGAREAASRNVDLCINSFSDRVGGQSLYDSVCKGKIILWIGQASEFSSDRIDFYDVVNGGLKKIISADLKLFKDSPTKNQWYLVSGELGARNFAHPDIWSGKIVELENEAQAFGLLNTLVGDSNGSAVVEKEVQEATYPTLDRPSRQWSLETEFQKIQKMAQTAELKGGRNIDEFNEFWSGWSSKQDGFFVKATSDKAISKWVCRYPYESWDFQERMQLNQSEAYDDFTCVGVDSKNGGIHFSYRLIFEKSKTGSLKKLYRDDVIVFDGYIEAAKLKYLGFSFDVRVTSLN